MTLFFVNPFFFYFSMTDQAYKQKGYCLPMYDLRKVDQRHRLKTHIYKEHMERGNVPSAVFLDTYASLANHLVHEMHSINISFKAA